MMRSFSIYITQIKPLESGDYKSVAKRPSSTLNNVGYNQLRNSEIYWAPLNERGYDKVVFLIRCI